MQSTFIMILICYNKIHLVFHIYLYKYQFAEFQGNINSDIYYIKYTCKLIYISSHQYMYCDNQTRHQTKDSSNCKA